MMHDKKTILLSQMPMTWVKIKPFLVHRTVGIVLAYLNCHMHISFVVIFTLVG